MASDESKEADRQQSGNGAEPALEAERSSDRPANDPGPADPEPNPLESAQAELAKIRDQLLRTLADFDNFRKRTRREVSDAERRGREELLKELLPVFDNLERAVMHAETATDVKSLADGIGMVMRQFADTLARSGIERVTSIGQPFDPALHEAIQQMESAEHPPGTVAAEVQAGYKLGDRLIRPALVVVAKAPSNGGDGAS